MFATLKNVKISCLFRHAKSRGGQLSSLSPNDSQLEFCCLMSCFSLEDLAFASSFFLARGVCANQ